TQLFNSNGVNGNARQRLYITTSHAVLRAFMDHRPKQRRCHGPDGRSRPVMTLRTSCVLRTLGSGSMSALRAKSGHEKLYLFSDVWKIVQDYVARYSTAFAFY